MPATARGRPTKQAEILAEFGENIRALTDEIEESVLTSDRYTALKAVHEINKELCRASKVFGYQFVEAA